MSKTIAVAVLALSLAACSDDLVNDASDHGSAEDVGSLTDAETMDTTNGGDAATADFGVDGGDLSDAGPTDMTSSDMTSSDMTSNDMSLTDTSLTDDMSLPDANPSDMSSTDVGADATADMAINDAGAEDDAGSGGYDTTGWTMMRWVKSDSASTGTPDSYFFDVDAGSPIAASITGGGSGTWSVNVFGGMTNTLYCTGAPGCQVMLDPQDTVVIVTAVTTAIGSYTLTVDYAGQGPR